MNNSTYVLILIFIVNSITLVYAAELTGYKKGGANMPITGYASKSDQSISKELETCEKNLGTISVYEPRDRLAKYDPLGIPVNLLRLIIQQSNCFEVVERGPAIEGLIKSRKLSSSGELQYGQNFGKNQMIAEDFILVADVNLSERNSGGAAFGAVIGSVVLGPIGTIAGSMLGGVKYKQAATSMIISDARSGLQVAAAQGSVQKADLGTIGFLNKIGGMGYTNTAQGKVIAAALLDNYNNIVRSIRNASELTQSKISEASRRNAEAHVRGYTYSVGAILLPKISGVVIYSKPNEASNIIGKLQKIHEVVFLGVNSNEFIKVQSAMGRGWVNDIMMKEILSIRPL